MAVFGPGFTSASPALAILLLVPVSTTMVVVLSQSLIATDRPLATSTSAAIRLIATLIPVLILTRSMGITGTAIGMAVGGAVQLVGQLALVQRDVVRLFRSWWPLRQMLAQALAYCAGFAAARGVVTALPGFAGLVIALGLGVAAYLACLVGAGGLTYRDRRRIASAWSAFRARAGLPHGAASTEIATAAVAAFQHGERLEREGDVPGAIKAYREGDANGSAAAACNLGVLLEQQRELASAQAAYARADQRGNANGAFNLGLLLKEQGHRAPAIAAFHRADQRGHAGAACNIGVALEEQGDLAGAAAAYERAAKLGDAHGSFNLGLVRQHQGDFAGATAAFRRAEQGNDWIADLAATARTGLPAGEAEQAPRGRVWPRRWSVRRL
jgi:Tfp pilus assembly protein PilF